MRGPWTFFFPILFFFFFCIHGCAKVPSPPVDDALIAAWQSRLSRLGSIDGWMIVGRLSVHAEGEGWQATLRWQRDRDRHEIDLTGPLGRGHIKLIQDRNGATLLDAKEQSYTAASADRLLADVTGWRLPLEGLYYWIRAVPVPDVSLQYELDGEGRLRTLQQQGWHIQYLAYRKVDGYDLPLKLFLHRQLGDSNATDLESVGTLNIRLAVDRWSLTPIDTRE